MGANAGGLVDEMVETAFLFFDLGGEGGHLRRREKRKLASKGKWEQTNKKQKDYQITPMAYLKIVAMNLR